MLLLLSLWFGASLVRRSKGETKLAIMYKIIEIDDILGEYTYLYGGIVAQTIQNASENNEDVSEAVAVGCNRASGLVAKSQCHLTYNFIR